MPLHTKERLKTDKSSVGEDEASGIIIYYGWELLGNF